MNDDISDDISDVLDGLDAIIKIAGANFPSDTDLRIEVLHPKRVSGSLIIASYRLAQVIELARAALSRAESQQ